MKTFTFSKLSKLGEHDEKYGTTYWGEPNEQVEPVKFNSMNQDIIDTDTIEAEEILLKTSGKGIEYHQLKKVKVVGGVKHEPGSETPPPPQETVDLLTLLTRIEAKLDKLLGEPDPLDAPIYERGLDD